MSDRLADLQRQRSLAQEQVAWFDREIAKETGPKASTIPAAVALTSGQPLAPTATDRTADEILAQYQPNPLTAAKDIKRGCYLYFAFALGAVVIAAVGTYLIYTRQR